jgi:uncharacterized protein
MSVDWANFTPGASLLGGTLIGVAAGILVLGAGRVMGAAGILGGALNPRPGDVAWRAVVDRRPVAGADRSLSGFDD